MAFLYWVHLPEHTDMFSQGYVGVTTRSVGTRWAAHKAASKVAGKAHLPLYRAISKYKEAGLVVETLVEASEEYVLDLEIKLRPNTGVGWNCAMGGQATGRGRVHSAEERAKRALSSTGRKHSLESRQKMSESNKGRAKSAEHKLKCGIAALGHKRSQGANERVASKLRGRKKITEAGRKRLSESKRALQTWEHSKADKRLWASALEHYSLLRTHGKFSSRYLALHLGVSDSSVATMCLKFKAGWNPSEDAAYQLWLTNYKEAR